jgi:hypothetical protein
LHQSSTDRLSLDLGPIVGENSRSGRGPKSAFDHERLPPHFRDMHLGDIDYPAAAADFPKCHDYKAAVSQTANRGAADARAQPRTFASHHYGPRSRASPARAVPRQSGSSPRFTLARDKPSPSRRRNRRFELAQRSNATDAHPTLPAARAIGHIGLGADRITEQRRGQRPLGGLILDSSQFLRVVGRIADQVVCPIVVPIGSEGASTVSCIGDADTNERLRKRASSASSAQNS